MSLLKKVYENPKSMMLFMTLGGMGRIYYSRVCKMERDEEGNSKLQRSLTSQDLSEEDVQRLIDALPEGAQKRLRKLSHALDLVEDTT